MNQRNESGQFLPGKSGNPSGRPSSESSEIRKQLAAHSNEVIKVVMDAALRGDLQACKMVLDRISPTLKAQSDNIHVSLPTGSNMQQTAQAFIDAASEGLLSPDVASQMVSNVSHLAHIAQITELSDRLVALERSVKEGNNV